VRSDPYACPINRALSRTLSIPQTDVEVDTTIWIGAQVDDDWSTFVGTLPTKAQEFIEAFDTDETVEPFEFDVLVELQE
jgi:hypothetical protein